MTTTQFTTEGVQYLAAGPDTTGGGLDEAIRRANAAVVEVRQTVSQIEDGAKQEAILEEQELRGGMGAGSFDALSTRPDAIRLDDTVSVSRLNAAVTGRADSIDDGMKSIMRKPGVYNNSPVAGPSQLDSLGGGFRRGGVSMAKVEEASLLSESRPKAKDGNLKGGDSYSAAGSLGIQRAPAPAAPQLAAAPSAPGMGMGGGGAGRVRRSINTSALDVGAPEKVAGSIAREIGLRGSVPAELQKFSRHQAQGVMSQAEQQGMAPQQAVTHKNPFLMAPGLDLANGPKFKAPGSTSVREEDFYGN